MRDPFKIEGPAVISFSGGRTSGRMLCEIASAYGGSLPPLIKTVFNNTGLEREETLAFVERCSQRWDIPVNWLEYRYQAPITCPTRDSDWTLLSDDEKSARWDVWHVGMKPIRDQHERNVRREMRRRKNLTPKERRGLPRLSRGVGRHAVAVVDFASASRQGEPLEEVIAARNMLPNVVSRFCTVEGKIRSTTRFLTSLGWTSWTNAIGFRADEPARIAKLRGTNRHGKEEPVTPLAAAGITKSDVAAWWKRQPFDLELMDHEGNCSLCFLKGIGKTLRILRDHPQDAGWYIRMEATAVRRGLARNKSVAFFRKDRPRYSALLELSKRPSLFDVDEVDELSIACHCTD